MAASEKEADSATPTTLSKTITFDVKTECLFLKITKTQRRHKIEKIKSNWRNYLICSPDCGGVHNTPETKNTLTLLSAITVMQMIFWTGHHFCFIYDCGNSVNCKPKKSYKLAGYF